MSDYLAADQLDAVRDVAISQSADQAIPAPAFQIRSDLIWRAKADLMTPTCGPKICAQERARQ
jgi:hypothetical protein